MGSRIQLSDFVGDHGSYQLFITILLFNRYILLGLMANSGSLLTPDVTFYCKLPMEEIVAIMPNITTKNQTEQEIEMKEEFKRICQLDLHLYQRAYLNTSLNQVASKAANKQLNTTLAKSFGHKFNTTNNIRECTDFTYDEAPDQGRTMTSEFDLICDRDWLRSLFQSLLSVAIVVGYVFWGTFSDKYGRFKAQKLCMIVSFLAGASSIFAPDFWTFAITRSLCSFGDLGLVVSLTTTVVELVGNQYRGLSVAIVNFGYALGVACLPYIVSYFQDFKLMIAFTVLCHLLTVPFVLTTNESIRWLLTNRKYKSAKKELKRINKWNRYYINESQQYRESLKPQIETTNKTKSKAEIEEEAFNLLFNKFIDQLESQNICDPFGDESESSFASAEAHAEAGVVLMADNSKPSEDIHVIVRSASNDTDSNNDQYRHFEGVAEMPGSSNSCGTEKRCSNERPSSCETGGEGSDSGIQDLACAEKEKKKKKKSCCCCRSRRPEILEENEVNKEQSLIADIIIHEDISKPEEGCGLNEDRPASRVRRATAAQQPDCINLVANQLSFVTRVSQLFKDKQLMIAVFTIVWTTFNSELQYTSFIIINLEVGEDVYLNYILGGCMEALAAISASLLLSYAPRRQSLIIFWLLISFSCFGLSIAHIDSTWAVWLLALAKFSQSCLSSIASVAAYESFPTFLRQSGSGLVFTLGMLGSVFAPLIFAEFDDHAGMDRVLMTFSFSSLTAAVLIYLYLKETKNCELK